MARYIRKLDPKLNQNLRSLVCRCPEAIEGEHECPVVAKLLWKSKCYNAPAWDEWFWSRKVEGFRI